MPWNTPTFSSNGGICQNSTCWWLAVLERNCCRLPQFSNISFLYQHSFPLIFFKFFWRLGTILLQKQISYTTICKYLCKRLVHYNIFMKMELFFRKKFKMEETVAVTAINAEWLTAVTSFNSSRCTTMLCCTLMVFFLILDKNSHWNSLYNTFILIKGKKITMNCVQ